MPIGLIDPKIARPTTLGSTSGLKGALTAAGSTAATRAAGAATTAAVAYGIRTLEKASGLRFDPAPAYLFYVELSGIIVALFTGCGGLSVQRDTDKVQEGGVNDVVRQLPGRLKYSNITLKRGLSISRALWDWFQQGRYDFAVRRINFSIIQGAPGHNLATAIAGAFGMDSGSDAFLALSRGFGKVKHWDVEDAYPVKWEISDLATSASDRVVIETLEIAHHGLSLSYEVGTPMSLTAGASDLVNP
jgi:phage tail-like protein